MKTSYSIVACTIAAAASLLRGGNYHHDAATVPAASPTGVGGGSCLTRIRWY
jgi:hypothetical protein